MDLDKIRHDYRVALERRRRELTTELNKVNKEINAIYQDQPNDKKTRIAVKASSNPSPEAFWEAMKTILDDTPRTAEYIHERLKSRGLVFGGVNPPGAIYKRLIDDPLKRYKRIYRQGFVINAVSVVWKENNG